MYLLPGEEVMFGPEDSSWLTFEDHFPEDYDIYPGFGRPLRFVRCRGSCPRDRRPFECRTFPVVPLIADHSPDGNTGRDHAGQDHIRCGGSGRVGDTTFELAFNADGILICPLVQSGDLSLLDREFLGMHSSVSGAHAVSSHARLLQVGQRETTCAGLRNRG